MTPPMPYQTFFDSIYIRSCHIFVEQNNKPHILTYIVGDNTCGNPDQGCHSRMKRTKATETVAVARVVNKGIM